MRKSDIPREIRYERYRKSLCATCGERPYSAGRTVCDECYAKIHVSLEPGLKREEAPRPRAARRTVRVRRSSITTQ